MPSLALYHVDRFYPLCAVGCSAASVGLHLAERHLGHTNREALNTARAALMGAAAGLVVYNVAVVARDWICFPCYVLPEHATPYAEPQSSYLAVVERTTIAKQLLGDLPDLNDEAGEEIFQNMKKHVDAPGKPLALGSYFLYRPRLFVFDPRDIRYLTSHNSVGWWEKGWIYDGLFRMALGNGLVTILDENFHTRQRRAVAAAFSTTAIVNMANHIMASHVNHDFESLARDVTQHESANKGTERMNFHASKFFAELALGIVEDAAFLAHELREQSTKQPDELEESFSQTFGTEEHSSVSRCARSVLEAMRPDLMMFFPCLCLLPFVRRTGIVRNGVNRITKRLLPLIESCRERPASERRKVLLNYVSENPELSDELVRDHSLTFFFAGHETSATALSWLTYALAAHPRVQSLLFDELSSMFGPNTVPTLSELKTGARYLKAVINESLRMYPIVEASYKVTPRGDVLPSGIVVPPNTDVVIPLMYIAWMERFWGPDAREFKPERWLDAADQADYASTEGPGWVRPGPLPADLDVAFAPFSVGKRNCIGQDFALAELMITVAVFVRRFVLTWPEGAPRPVRDWGPTIHSKQPIVVEIATRAS